MDSDRGAVLNDYIAAENEAAQRTRWVTVALIIVTLFTFITAWNSRLHGWEFQRLTRWQGMADCLRLKGDPTVNCASKAKYFDEYGISLAAGALDDVLEHLRRQREVVHQKIEFVSTPFFGLQFDINDLGVFAGLTFIFLLGTLRYVLARQAGNSDRAFREAEAQDRLEETYWRMGMRQVFFAPPGDSSACPPGPGNTAATNQAHVAFWRRVTRLPIAAPVLAQSFILANDALSFWAGAQTNATAQTEVVGFEIVSTLGMVVLTVGCMHALSTLEHTWCVRARSLGLGVQDPDPHLHGTWGPVRARLRRLTHPVDESSAAQRR